MTTNWVVAGTGALGTLWALGLARHDARVQIYSRHVADSPELLLQSSGLSVDERRFPVINDPDMAAPGATWLVMVKAWQLKDVLEQLEQSFAEQSLTLVLSHNGMGAGEDVLQRNPQWQVYDLVTTQGAWRRTRFHSVHAGSGQSWLGARNADDSDAQKPAWLPVLENAVSPLHWDSDIALRRWQKLAINCAINPLASLAGQVNGILKDAKYQQQIASVCDEIAAVNKKLDAQTLKTQVHQVIAATAGNKCSMLQDIEAGTQTEVNYLNGYVCRLGKEKGISTPVNCELADRILKISNIKK